MPIIEIMIDDKGNPVVKVEGMTGPGCKDLTAALEQDLGVVSEDEKTPDYYAKQAQHAAQRAKQ